MINVDMFDNNDDAKIAAAAYNQLGRIAKVYTATGILIKDRRDNSTKMDSGDEIWVVVTE